MIACTSTHFVRYVNLLCYSIPNFINTIPIVESFEYSITSYHDVIEVVLNLKTYDVWLTNYHIRVSTILRTLCLYISKRFGYTKPAWKNSQWSLDIQVFFVWVLSSFGECLSSINLSTCCLDSNFLQFIVRFVIP